jgi:hypothetical protein
MSPRRTRQTRPQADLLDALASHVRVLQAHFEHAFRQGNADYFGEVAGKLRLLVCKTRTNRPLLLDLMDEFGFEQTFELRSSGNLTTLREYMTMLAYAGTLPTGESVSMSNSELVLAWSQQLGASHEDWDIDPALAHAVYAGVYIGGVPATAAALRATARTVLHVADSFLAERAGGTAPTA